MFHAETFVLRIPTYCMTFFCSKKRQGNKTNVCRQFFTCNSTKINTVLIERPVGTFWKANYSGLAKYLIHSLYFPSMIALNLVAWWSNKLSLVWQLEQQFLHFFPVAKFKLLSSWGHGDRNCRVLFTLCIWKPDNMLHSNKTWIP